MRAALVVFIEALPLCRAVPLCPTKKCQSQVLGRSPALARLVVRVRDVQSMIEILPVSATVLARMKVHNLIPRLESTRTQFRDLRLDVVNGEANVVHPDLI